MQLLLILLVATIGCQSVDTDIAENILERTLLSPASYEQIRSGTIWSGVSEDGHYARVVEIHYDAQTPMEQC